MAAAAPDIVVTDYESFNARIIQVVGEGSDLLMAGTLGRKLTLGGAIEEEEFGRSGLHVASEIGAVMARMVDLGDKIDWSTAVFDWPGQKDFTRFAMHNQPLLTLVLRLRGRCGTDTHAHYLINPSGANRATSLACQRPFLRKDLASQLVHRCVWHVVWVSTGHPVPTVLARMHYRALDHYMQPAGGNEWTVARPG